MATFVSSESTLPLPQIVIRGRTALQAYSGPSVARTETSVSYSVATSEVFNAIDDLRIAPIYSPNGQVLAVVHETKNLSLYSSTGGEKIMELPVADVQKAEFSPLGTFLVTWSRPTKGSAEGGSDGNLRVWKCLTGEFVVAYSLKTYKAESIQWTADESYCFRMVTNEIQIYAGQGLTEGVVDKVYHKGLASFGVSPTSNPVGVAVFNPDAGGKPARVTLYSFKGLAAKGAADTAVEGPLNSRTIFSASEAKLLWNSTGTALLVHSHSDVDSSNSSYYGATGLYILLAGSSDVSAKVEQSKEGPIHDVQWSPAGDRFVVSAGTMPCHSTLYNTKGEPVYQFGAAHRNTISWSPHGRFLCLAGFGNLAGEMDFFDTLRLKKLGSNVSHCSTAYSWSPDSSYFLTASLAPRMNVDNGFRVFKYNGVGPVVHQPLERAFDALWRPAAAGVYPARHPSPKRPNGEEPAPAVVIAAQEVKPKAAPYRPPGSSGDTANFMRREEGPAVGKIKKEAPAAAAAAAKPAAYVPPKRSIPGMPVGAAPVPGAKKPAAAPASTSSGSTANSKPAAAPAAPKAPAAAAAAKPSAPAPAPAPVALTPAELAAEKEKRIKNLKKKLKQLDEIKAKQASGQSLEPEQVQKLQTEAALLAELRGLEA